ncbi:MAG: glycosyl hydrolase [Candidatus Staskawiczbacteria bacterium]|nr:glycosyl hydrolase [Candidatus Staskawiczbacteria bacterium]
MIRLTTKLLLTVLLASAFFLGAQQASAASSAGTYGGSSFWQQITQTLRSKMDSLRSQFSLKTSPGQSQKSSTSVKSWDSSSSKATQPVKTYTRRQFSTLTKNPAPYSTQTSSQPSSPEPVAPTDSSPSQPTVLPSSSSSKMWGAYTGNTASSFTNFEQQVGKQADINAVFTGWGDSFPVDLASPLKSNGQSILIFWEQYGVTLDQIINGSQDSYIEEFASDAKAYGGQVFLAPFHEMNGDWDPWGGTVGNNTPAKVVSAWKHVHDLFSGASNVKFVWSVNNVSVPNTSENAIANYYPGSSYVDYTAVDGFNFGSPWQTYDQVFSSALGQLEKYSKPILITSMASAAGSEKSAWITDALSKIYSDSSIKGFVWFNENKEQNWLINSDSASLKAFQDGIK